MFPEVVTSLARINEALLLASEFNTKLPFEFTVKLPLTYKASPAVTLTTPSDAIDRF